MPPEKNILHITHENNFYNCVPGPEWWLRKLHLLFSPLRTFFIFLRCICLFLWIIFDGCHHNGTLATPLIWTWYSTVNNCFGTGEQNRKIMGWRLLVELGFHKAIYFLQLSSPFFRMVETIVACEKQVHTCQSRNSAAELLSLLTAD